MTTAQRLAIASPYVSMLVYDSDLKSLMVWNGSLWTPAGGGATLKSTITQAHSFTSADIGTPLYLIGSTYTKARADSSSMAEVAGLLESIVDANTFSLALCGDVTIASAVRGGSNLTPGDTYFLSSTNAGQITATEPSVVGYVSKPIGIAKDQTTLSFFNMRGSVVGSSNVRTQISIANNATTTIQNVSAYEAGELTGWVSISATTPLKFYLSAQFSKNGAGTDYNLSYQTTGDTPPTGFSVAVTAAGIIQIVMPNVTGFASASINYALNAPAVGVTLPLSIDVTNVSDVRANQNSSQATYHTSFAGSANVKTISLTKPIYSAKCMVTVSVAMNYVNQNGTAMQTGIYVGIRDGSTVVHQFPVDSISVASGYSDKIYRTYSAIIDYPSGALSVQSYEINTGGGSYTVSNIHFCASVSAIKI
jgi:hypothetical protein